MNFINKEFPTIFKKTFFLLKYTLGADVYNCTLKQENSAL